MECFLHNQPSLLEVLSLPDSGLLHGMLFCIHPNSYAYAPRTKKAPRPSAWPLSSSLSSAWMISPTTSFTHTKKGRTGAAAVMDAWVRFSAQSQARERLCRAAQYACSLLGHALQKHGASPELQKQIRQLEGHLSLGRKLLHLGNSADALESAKRAVHLSDVVLRFCITVSHLNRALYFACDNVLWAGKSGLAPRVDQEKWAQRSFRFDILLSYKVYRILHTTYLAFHDRTIF